MIDKNRKKTINGFPHVAFAQESHDQPGEVVSRSLQFFEEMNERRSVRDFADTPVPREAIEHIIRTATTAPSGAHKQPWTFCAIADPELKRRIREAAETEEKTNYGGRMSERWKKDLLPLGTDEHKAFLETAPWLIVVFRQIYECNEQGEKHTHYYVNESVGIASGLLIAAIHRAGLVTLTHTPSPMNFLAEILNRPDNERAFLLLPVGYAAADAFVPDIARKPLTETSVFYE